MSLERRNSPSPEPFIPRDQFSIEIPPQLDAIPKDTGGELLRVALPYPLLVCTLELSHFSGGAAGDMSLAAKVLLNSEAFYQRKFANGGLQDAQDLSAAISDKIIPPIGTVSFPAMRPEVGYIVKGSNGSLLRVRADTSLQTDWGSFHRGQAVNVSTETAIDPENMRGELTDMCGIMTSVIKGTASYAKVRRLPVVSLHEPRTPDHYLEGISYDVVKQYVSPEVYAWIIAYVTEAYRALADIPDGKGGYQTTPEQKIVAQQFYACVDAANLGGTDGEIIEQLTKIYGRNI